MLFPSLNQFISPVSYKAIKKSSIKPNNGPKHVIMSDVWNSRDY